MVYFVLILVILFLLAFAGFELIYLNRDPKSIVPLLHERTKWEITSESHNERTYACSFNFRNQNTKYEGTLVKMSIEQNILYKNEHIDDLQLQTKLIPDIYSIRNDGYIPAFLMPALKSTKVKIEAKFTGNKEDIEKVHAIVLKIKYTIYDRKGYHQNKFKDIIFVPVKEAVQENFNALQEKGAYIYPVKTHLLTDEDDMASVIKKYAGTFIKEGDIAVIAESPVAITEGRYWHPTDLKLNWWAKRLCYFVPSVGSLSSPYGMQSAMDQIGTCKVVFAMFIGALMKLLGKNGWFYTLAGLESELIDDLTGTIPPYDQYIVLGPKNPEKYVIDLKNKIGIDVAIADANDLKKARILAATLKSEQDQIRKWMLNNPAGNSAEQTPIVIIRPEK